jgi:hypothetical protein
MPRTVDAETAAMRIRLNDPSLMPELVEFLETRTDAVVTQEGDHEVEVTLLGSYALDAMRMELYLRIRAWEAAHGGAVAEIL